MLVGLKVVGGAQTRGASRYDAVRVGVSEVTVRLRLLGPWRREVQLRIRSDFLEWGGRRLALEELWYARADWSPWPLLPMSRPRRLRVEMKSGDTLVWTLAPGQDEAVEVLVETIELAKQNSEAPEAETDKARALRQSLEIARRR